MGQGGSYKCNKCGYELDALTGVDFLYPNVCKENMEKAQRGELGEELKKFFEEHPDGKMDCSSVLLRCEDCGAYDVALDFGMYIPKDGTKANDAIWDLDGYKKIGSYKHVCSACGGAMKRVKEDADLICPECGEKLELISQGMWD